jgi:hypothetical protein
MIQFPEAIADAYVLPVRNVALPSTPGRTVRFLQGHAVIKDGRDLVAMMRRPDVKIHMTPYSMSWLETWMAEAGERVAAEIRIPDDHPVRAQGWEPPDGADGAEPDQGA